MLTVNPRLKRIRNLAMMSVLSGALIACGGGGGGDITDPRDTSGGGTTGGGTTTPEEVVTVLGNGTGDSFVQGAAKATETSLQAGASTLITINLVDSNNSNIAVSDVFTITFASDCVSNGLASFDEITVASASGLASATYTAEGCAGEDLVTVSTTIDNVIHSASATLTIETDQVLGVEFVSVSPAQLSLAGLGGG